MRASYPRFYQTTQSNEDVNTTINLWYELFKDDNLEIVKRAVLSLVNKLEFPPTIADVRKEIEKLVGTATNEPTAIEEYNAIRQAIKSSGYYSVENFEKLPEIAKQFVGSPSQLKEWALREDFNEEVLRGQFLKQYDSLKERQKHRQMLNSNPELNNLIQNIATSKAVLCEGREE